MEQTALLIDVNASRAAALASALTGHGWRTDQAADVANAVETLRQNRHELLIAFEGAAKDDLVELCRQARERSPHLAIIAGLVGPDPSAEEELLDAGVDDVVFDSSGPTVAAKRAVLRATRPANMTGRDGEIRLGDAVVNPETREVWREGERKRLSRLQARLLTYFIANPDRTVSRRELAHAVWDDSQLDPRSKSIEVQMSMLRKLIESTPSRPRVIITIRGDGYRLVSGPIRGQQAEKGS